MIYSVLTVRMHWRLPAILLALRDRESDEGLEVDALWFCAVIRA